MNDVSETLGDRLKAERVRRGLSCQKAADELHLDCWVIEGLESGDYARIGPAVYVKGHLRRYAEVLGLPVEEVMNSFDGRLTESATPADAASGIHAMPSSGARLPIAAIGGTIATLLVIAGVWLWHPWRPRLTPPPVPPTAASAVEPHVEASGPDAPVATANAPQAGVAKGPSGAAPPVSGPAPEATADANAGAGRARLRLLFVGDSWVDVHDAAGQRLYAGNGHVNNVRSLSGMAPMRVYLRTAANVHLDINNHAVAVGSQFVVDNAAHFLAGADGVLRRDPKAPAPNGAASAAPRPRG